LRELRGFKVAGKLEEVPRILRKFLRILKKSARIQKEVRRHPEIDKPLKNRQTSEESLSTLTVSRDPKNL
jgi:hypothetical protein